MTTIREYAKRKGVSYEAIRKQIARYREDLDGHITTKRQTKYLDDFAVSFLDDRRRDSPIIVYNQERSEEVQLLKDQVESLRNELMTTQKRVIDLQSENQLMIEAKIKYDLLLESNTEKQTTIDALRGDLKEAKNEANIARQAVDALRDQRDDARRETDAARKEAEEIRRERDEAREEAKSYRKSIFGFYRKTKYSYGAEHFETDQSRLY